MRKFHTAVLIGRFQIPHDGHQQLINQAAELADNLVILVGSVGQPRTPKNPFSFTERAELLEALVPTGVDVNILPVRDQRYNNNNWVVDVVNKVKATLPNEWSDYPPKIALVGHKKDSSSFYLDMFPQWQFIDAENHSNINASQIRDSLYKYPSQAPNNVSEVVFNFLQNWKLTPEFRAIQKEYTIIQDYKDSWGDSPFPPTFVTVDAVVIQSGHILLIQRKDAPGVGQWALPGGFLNQNESIQDAMLRELDEETQIKLQKIILERSITRVKVYDHPDRSSRGRTITHAFKIELKGSELPRIKGGSDANKAKWFPLNEVYMMGEEIYEDHLDIILDTVN
jgi:bifunctional NMN adenylyltransferase/nudix hydrolase